MNNMSKQNKFQIENLPLIVCHNMKRGQAPV